MNPQKLADFTQQRLLPEVADRYLEVELFPRIHFKVGRGISLRTARRWLHKEGFRYMLFRKGLYFDGHERPDVVIYRQVDFLPAMAKHHPRLVEYAVGNVGESRG